MDHHHCAGEVVRARDVDGHCAVLVAVRALDVDGPVCSTSSSESS